LERVWYVNLFLRQVIGSEFFCWQGLSTANNFITPQHYSAIKTFAHGVVNLIGASFLDPHRWNNEPFELERTGTNHACEHPFANARVGGSGRSVSVTFQVNVLLLFVVCCLLFIVSCLSFVCCLFVVCCCCFPLIIDF
jgi:hypothetical protein